MSPKTTYLPLTLNLDGLVLKHESQMSVGDDYICILIGRRRQRVVWKGEKLQKVRRDDYFLCERVVGAYAEATKVWDSHAPKGHSK
jgi:hypothetical protein